VADWRVDWSPSKSDKVFLRPFASQKEDSLSCLPLLRKSSLVESCLLECGRGDSAEVAFFGRYVLCYGESGSGTSLGVSCGRAV